MKLPALGDQAQRAVDQRGCAGKASFTTVKGAQRAIRAMLRRRREMISGERLAWYKCRCCALYHLGGGA